ncbi:MAG: Regulatory protein RecX [Pseudomonadota bacterium]|jgi:regulatory protein
MNAERPGPSLKARALRLLSQREHSRAELERKLREHETEPGSLAQALDELTAKGFISEQRVVESVLHRRANKLGTARVRQELQAKGLSAEAVVEAVVRLQDSELERARAVWMKKFATPATDAAERARQMRFLAARGFTGDVIRSVVRGAEDD